MIMITNNSDDGLCTEMFAWCESCTSLRCMIRYASFRLLLNVEER